MNKVNIMITGQVSANIKAQFFTIEGRMLSEYNLIDVKTEIDISPFPSGIYSLRITTDGSTVARKIIKQ